MTDHQIVNTILVIVALAIFGVRIVRKLGGAAAKLVAAEPPAAAQQRTAAQQPRRRPIGAVAQRFAPVAADAARAELPPARAELPPARAELPPAPRPPRMSGPAPAEAFAAAAADAFPTLDLTLPDAKAPAGSAPARPRRRAVGAGRVPGSRGWGPAAIVALEVLGPPVSLRSGATLGAPHAF